MAHLLLVDDDKDFLLLAQKALELYRHSVTATQDAFSALELLAERRFDVVISDANMPHYSGFDLFKTLRSDDRYKQLSLVMLTGRRSPEDIARAIQVGVVDYIIKPIDTHQFVQKVNKIIERMPSAQKTELSLADSPAQTTAHLRTRVQLRTLSEDGFTFHSPEPAMIGSTVEVESNLFMEIGLPVPALKVVSSLPLEESEAWEIKVHFVGLKETALQRLRMWIHLHDQRAKKAGAAKAA